MFLYTMPLLFGIIKNDQNVLVSPTPNPSVTEKLMKQKKIHLSGNPNIVIFHLDNRSEKMENYKCLWYFVILSLHIRLLSPFALLPMIHGCPHVVYILSRVVFPVCFCIGLFMFFVYMEENSASNKAPSDVLGRVGNWQSFGNCWGFLAYQRVIISWFQNE